MRANDRTAGESGPASAFGGVLRRYRQRLVWSQEDLADASGIAARTISDLERGVAQHPRPSTVRLLAEALGLAGQDLAAFTAAARPTADPEPPTPPPAPSGSAGPALARSVRCRRPASARRRARAVPWCT
jgi:DNA-binding XRE family transcriptional regulator